jgi:carbon dioxide concentrating mechanism protein CcmM
MLIDKIFGDPTIHKDAFLSRYAVIIGKVIIDQDVMVAPGAKIRADECAPYRICKGVNIQDNVIFHGLSNQYVEVGGIMYSIYIDSHSSIAHAAIVHGPLFVGKKCFIGFRSTVHASKIGRNCFVDGHTFIKNSTIGEYCHIGAKVLVSGVVIGRDRYVEDGKIIKYQDDADGLPIVPKALAEQDKAFNKHVVDVNKETLRVLYHERRRVRKEEKRLSKQKKNIFVQ